MPPPVVRQDALWEHRAMKDRQEELSRQAASEELRERCLARQQEQELQLRLQQAEDKHRWQAVQGARRAAKKSERAQSARGRNKALSEIEKLRKATRDDADAREACNKNEGRHLVCILRERDWDDFYKKRRAQRERAKAGTSGVHALHHFEEETKAMTENRQKLERELVELRRREQHRMALDRQASAEAEACRRAQVEMMRQQDRQKARAAMRAQLKAQEGKAGWDANLHYLNTHGDRLHWDPPFFKHTLEEDGDGRWPFPMLPAREPIYKYGSLQFLLDPPGGHRPRASRPDAFYDA
jgi:hypothetical protein